MEFEIGIWNGWWFALLNTLLSTGILAIFPKWVRLRFLKVPYIKVCSELLYINHVSMLLLSFFIPIQMNTLLFWIGSLLVAAGMGLFSWSLFTFATTPYKKLINSDLYALSRNPAYLSGHIYWLGVVLVLQNYIFTLLWIFHIILIHLQIQREEQNLLVQYGESYRQYKKQTKRYL